MTQDLALYQQGYIPTLDDIIKAWLHAKATHTNSKKTERAYKENFSKFRALLQSAGYDLDADPGLIAMFAQGWASQATRKQQIAPATYNHRIAIISSFYIYAIKHRVLKENPIKLVDSRKVEAKDYAEPLEAEFVSAQLHKINRETLSGLRDYALLSVAVTTGRRSGELAAMKWGDIHLAGNKMIVTWPRCKGDKLMVDELKLHTTEALLAYVKAIYAPVYGSLDDIPQATPIWLSFARNDSAGKPIGTQAISDICKKWFRTSKVHATRHTHAMSLEKAGASLSEIGARLGHSNLKTTSDYMKRHHAHENKYGDRLEELFGI